MARNYNVQDAYDIVNAMLANIQGIDQSLNVVDSSTFIDAGEMIKSMPTEDVLNSLSLVIGRTLVAVRPYDAKLDIFNRFDSGVFANRLRKISYYGTYAEYDGASNNQYHINHADGFDNGRNGAQTPAPGTPPEYPDSFTSASSMWVQNYKHPLEITFGGSSEWQTSLTLLEDALERAFASESDFMRFWDGMLTDKASDIEQMKEGFNYALLCNAIAATYAMNNGRQVINLTYEFNQQFNTSYNTLQLQTTYFTEFMEFFVSMVRKTSDLMTHRTVEFHQPVPQTFNGVTQGILRHTPKANQRLILWNPMLIDAEARVFPEVFNEEFLRIGAYEGVDFFQNFQNPTAINWIPSYPDYVANYGDTDPVVIDNVVGMLYDEDALMTDFQLERTTVTPLEAKKYYRNMFWTIRRNYIFDATENIVIFVMEDPEDPGNNKSEDIKEEPKEVKED